MELYRIYIALELAIESRENGHSPITILAENQGVI